MAQPPTLLLFNHDVPAPPLLPLLVLSSTTSKLHSDMYCIWCAQRSFNLTRYSSDCSMSALNIELARLGWQALLLRLGRSYGSYVRAITRCTGTILASLSARRPRQRPSGDPYICPWPGDAPPACIIMIDVRTPDQEQCHTASLAVQRSSANMLSISKHSLSVPYAM